MTGAQKSEGGSVLCAVRDMLTSLRDEVSEVLRKEFESPKNRRSRRGSRRSRIPRNSSLPNSRSQSVPANPEQAASRQRARSSSRGSRRSRSASPHNHCSRVELGCPRNPIMSSMSPLWNSSTEVPEFGRRALPIVYWQPTAARRTKSQAATHHKCRSLRHGCADRRCRTEVAPHARFHRRKLCQAQFSSWIGETIYSKA